MPWKNGGGTTHEVARFPSGDGDDFGWRVSFCEVVEPGPFSTFRGIDRVITLVDGAAMRLRVTPAGGGAAVEHHLRAGEPFAFAGEDEVEATPDGATLDFNVMIARGRYAATVTVTGGSDDALELSPGEHLLVASLWGDIVVRSTSDEVLLERMDVAISTSALTVSGVGTAILVRIRVSR